MPLLVATLSDDVSVNNLLRAVVTGSLSFLSALSLREVLVAATAAMTPPGTKESLVFTVFIALVVLLLTIVVTVVWV